LIDALRESDRDAIAALMADDVEFHSPVADYRGREQVVHLLATIAGVIDDIRTRRELGEGLETVTFVEGEVAGRAVDGVLDEIRAEDGRIVELTLMLRPLDALMEGVKRMAAALTDTP
jgi:ketosteroid isomerase-like protein